MNAVEPICQIDKSGNECWYLDGKFHRIDGPAVKNRLGTKSWYINGKLHRTDGAAIEYATGDKAWYLNGKEYSFEEWDRLRKMIWML